MPRTLGFVGLGHMGGAMAIRFLDAGYAVVGTARNRGRAQPLVDRGLRWCDTPEEVAAAADLVLTSLPGDDEVESIGRVLTQALAPGQTWIDLSTVSPRLSRELAARVREQGAQMLDAPVSGSVPQVEAGTLTIMVGGDEAAFATVEPILRVLGTATRIGDNGQGLVLKQAINIAVLPEVIGR
jgi:3-hydroxyisobutyrate dehydrogenase-like beta-hydroxyacid dehydrogenase